MDDSNLYCVCICARWFFIWILNFKKVEPNKNDAATEAGEGDGDE